MMQHILSVYYHVLPGLVSEEDDSSKNEGFIVFVMYLNTDESSLCKTATKSLLSDVLLILCLYSTELVNSIVESVWSLFFFTLNAAPLKDTYITDHTRLCPHSTCRLANAIANANQAQTGFPCAHMILLFLSKTLYNVLQMHFLLFIKKTFIF